MTAQEIAESLDGCKKTKRGWQARCPAHDDKNGSLSISETKDGKVLMKCFAGCETSAIVQAMGLDMRDLFPAKPEKRIEKKQYTPRTVVCNYDYYGPLGNPLIRVVRYVPKSFGRMRPKFGEHGEFNGQWEFGGTGDIKALYHWPELRAATATGKVVYMVEGEKDCDNLRLQGCAVTCNLGGASKWQPVLAEEFKGASRVVIIADNDVPGKKYASAVRRDIVSQGIEVTALTLPEEKNGKHVKDISDFLAAGGTVAELEELVSSAPAWEDYEEKKKAVAAEGLAAQIAAEIEEARDENKGRLPVEERCLLVSGIVVQWLVARGALYIDDRTRLNTSIIYVDGKTKNVYAVDSDRFRTWLSNESGLRLGGKDMEVSLDAISVAANATDNGTRITAAKFWDRRGDSVYISCGEGQMVRVTSSDVCLLDNGADGVLFAPSKTLESWKVVPRDSAACPLEADVFGGMETADPLSPLLFLLWVLALPLNMPTKPPLILWGTPGSGKSKVAQGLYELLGMAPRLAAITDKGEADFWASISGGGVLTLDNADECYKWLVNSIAAAATGAGREQRVLYTNDQLVNLMPDSALCVTSANPEFARDPGVADRLIVIQLERREGKSTKDSELTRQIVSRRDEMMSWIAYTIADALRVQETPPEGLNRRHPDWAAWAWRCGVALGCRDASERVLKIAEANKSLTSILADSYIGRPIYDLVCSQPSGYWTGTAVELQQALTDTGEYSIASAAKLSAGSLGKRLAASWPHYQKVFRAEILVGHARQRTYLFRVPTWECGADGEDNLVFLSLLGKFLKNKKEKNIKKDEIAPPSSPNAPIETVSNSPVSFESTISPSNRRTFCPDGIEIIPPDPEFPNGF